MVTALRNLLDFDLALPTEAVRGKLPLDDLVTSLYSYLAFSQCSRIVAVPTTVLRSWYTEFPKTGDSGLHPLGGEP